MSYPLFLNIEDLNFGYQKDLLLEGIYFKVIQGEFVAIIGPNGGGKTTLLKLIMGFLKPSKGHILIDGLPPQQARQKIGYVPQHLHFDRLFPITAKEVVLQGTLRQSSLLGPYSKENKQAALQALEKVHLSHLSDKSFGTLSGGEIQRTLLARAIVNRPQLLLLDEPTASVDADAEESIFSYLKEIRSHLTVMMVTHDLNAAIQLADRVLCVNRGLTIMEPKEICNHTSFGLYHTPNKEKKDRDEF